MAAGHPLYPAATGGAPSGVALLNPQRPQQQLVVAQGQAGVRGMAVGPGSAAQTATNGMAPGAMQYMIATAAQPTPVPAYLAMQTLSMPGHSANVLRGQPNAGMVPQGVSVQGRTQPMQQLVISPAASDSQRPMGLPMQAQPQQTVLAPASLAPSIQSQAIAQQPVQHPQPAYTMAASRPHSHHQTGPTVGSMQVHGHGQLQATTHGAGRPPPPNSAKRSLLYDPDGDPLFTRVPRKPRTSWYFGSGSTETVHNFTADDGLGQYSARVRLMGGHGLPAGGVPRPGMVLGRGPGLGPPNGRPYGSHLALHRSSSAGSGGPLPAAGSSLLGGAGKDRIHGTGIAAGGMSARDSRGEHSGSKSSSGQAASGGRRKGRPPRGGDLDDDNRAALHELLAPASEPVEVLDDDDVYGGGRRQGAGGVPALELTLSHPLLGQFAGVLKCVR